MEYRQRSTGGPTVPALGPCAVDRPFSNNAEAAVAAVRTEAD